MPLRGGSDTLVTRVSQHNSWLIEPRVTNGTNGDVLTDGANTGLYSVVYHLLNRQVQAASDHGKECLCNGLTPHK